MSEEESILGKQYCLFTNSRVVENNWVKLHASPPRKTKCQKSQQPVRPPMLIGEKQQRQSCECLSEEERILGKLTWYYLFTNWRMVNSSNNKVQRGTRYGKHVQKSHFSNTQALKCGCKVKLFPFPVPMIETNERWWPQNRLYHKHDHTFPRCAI